MSRAIPRLSFDELPVSMQELLRSKVERLGYLGEFFAATAHQEAASCAFARFTEESKGALSPNIVELIVLTIATTHGIDYEKNQHERLCEKLGFSRAWIQDAERLAPESSENLDQPEKQVQRFVIDALASNGEGSGPQLDEIVATFGVDDAVAILMVCSRYIAHSFMVNALAIEAPVPSIFSEQG